MPLSDDDERRARLLFNAVSFLAVGLFVVGGLSRVFNWPGQLWWTIAFILALIATLVGLASWGSRDTDVRPMESWRAGRRNVLDSLRSQLHEGAWRRVRMVIDVPAAMLGLGFSWIAAQAVTLSRRARPH